MFRVLLISMLLLPVVADAQEDPTAPETEKRAYFWLRMWPDFLLKYDIEKDEEAARIQSKNGLCHGVTFSHDETQAFLITGKKSKVEVFDLINNEVVEVHDFSETGWLNRVDGVREIPGGKRWYVNIDRVKLEPDHYKIERSQWLLYDVEKKEILKKLRELPSAIRRGAQISPDGTKWHVFGRDLLVLDPENLKEIAKINLSTPLYSGMGPISVSSRTDLFFGEKPKRYRFLYTMTDPVRTNRRLGGVVELDLEEMKIVNRVEWGSAPRSWRLFITRDGKRAIGTGSSGRGGGQGSGEDPIVTLVEYSLEDGSKVKETRVPSRNGLSLAGISPDGNKIYFTGRGHEIVIIDGDHQPLKTVEMEGELEGRLHLIWQ